MVLLVKHICPPSLALAIFLLVVSAATSSAQPVSTDLPALKQALAAAVERMGSQLSLVGEERQVQVKHYETVSIKAPHPALAWDAAGKLPRWRRRWVAEVLLTQGPGEQWAFYRDVRVVDDEPVTEGRATEMNGPAQPARWADATSRSRQYDLGSPTGNLAEPYLALSFLRGTNHSRFEFKKMKDETLDGRVTRVIGFKETGKPSLVNTKEGRAVPVTGSVWLDAERGDVLRTELTFQRPDNLRSFVRVDYEPNDDLRLSVPVRMWEWREGAPEPIDSWGQLRGIIESMATYSAFRRAQAN